MYLFLHTEDNTLLAMSLTLTPPNFGMQVGWDRAAATGCVLHHATALRCVECITNVYIYTSGTSQFITKVSFMLMNSVIFLL
jgi:hypothetical protein